MLLCLCILLYGAEVWGPYVFNDYADWERNDIEKVHTQFVKRIIGCDVRTSNLMARTEVGRRPLICDIIQKSLVYLNNMESNLESLAGQALKYEWENSDKDNIFQLAREFPHLYRGPNQSVESLDKKKIRNCINESYKQIWNTEIRKLSKAESYKQFKENITFEKYLSIIENEKHRKALTRLRLSCHPLMIEKGRHHKIPIPRTERFCPFCTSEVETEQHFVTYCSKYDTERLSLFRIASENSIHFENMSYESKFIFLFSNENKHVLSKLGAFAYNSFKHREASLA